MKSMLCLSRKCSVSFVCQRRLTDLIAGGAPVGIYMSTKACYTSSSNDILLRNDNDNGVSTLTLNGPKQFNTLTSDLLTALQQELTNISQDDSVRVVIINSSSPKCFSSGHDLKELLESSQQDLESLFHKCSNVMSFLTQQLPQPVIAQVHGICTAAGTQLVASCDLAVCSENSKFGVNGIDVGLFCSTPAVALSRNVPRKHAMQMLLTGDFVSAHKALEYGLVNQVVSNDDLENATMELANKIASKSPFAIQLGKKAFYKQLDMDSLNEAYEFASDKICFNMDSYDAREGIRAFLEKRQPEWRGK